MVKKRNLLWKVKRQEIVKRGLGLNRTEVRVRVLRAYFNLLDVAYTLLIELGMNCYAEYQLALRNSMLHHDALAERHAGDG